MDRVAAGIRKAKERQAGGGGVAAGLPSETVWAELTPFFPDPATMARRRIVTFGRTDPACAAFEMLRTKLLLLARQHGWTSVGITSPTNGCGKTTISLNLAFSLAQLNLRILLVDLDLRRPAIARQVGLSGQHSMAGVLQGTHSAAESFVRCGDNLAIGSNSEPIRNSANVLLSEASAKGIASLKAQFAPDIILYDLPPMLVADDALAFLPHLDCVLLIVGAEVTRPDEVWVCKGELANHCGFVGIVVNKCRYAEADDTYATGEVITLLRPDR
jgi:Mrp family chromosome partitioning ATPase